MKSAIPLLYLLVLVVCLVEGSQSQNNKTCGLPFEPDMNHCECIRKAFFYNPDNQTCQSGVVSCCGQQKNLLFDSMMACVKRCIDEGCRRSTFGCCRDGINYAKGPDYQGCTTFGDCGSSEFGCCHDQIRSASGPNFQGCTSWCEDNEGGCCPDGVTWNDGWVFNLRACPPDVCMMPKSPGECTAKWTRFYYDSDKGECLKFKYGGCGGNANRFLTWDQCERMCVKKDYSCYYRGQKLSHETWWFDSCNEFRCLQGIVYDTKDPCWKDNKDTCPYAEFERSGDSCYSYSNGAMTYKEAVKECRSYGESFTLAQPKTPKQNKQLLDYINYMKQWLTIDHFWIGLRQDNRWENGVKRVFWSGFPQGPMCTRIVTVGDNPGWSPFPCSNKSAVICEAPVVYYNDLNKGQ